MRYDLSKLKDGELRSFFYLFKETVQNILKSNQKFWNKEINKLKRKSENGKIYNWNKDTLKRYLENLDLKDNNQSVIQRYERHVIIDLIITACDAWKIDITEEGKIINRRDFNTEIHNEQHYLCYYWLQDNDLDKTHPGVDVGYFSLGFNENNFPISATMKLFDFYESARLKQEKSIPTAILSGNEDDIYSENNFMVVRLEDSTHPEIRSQLSLSVEKKFSLQQPGTFIIGTYNSIGRKSSAGQPIAGLLVLKKVENFSDAIDNITESERQVADHIYYFLFNSRLSIQQSTWAHFYQMQNENETKALIAYSGAYLVDLISDSNSDTPIHETAVLYIYPNTKAIMYVPNSNSPGLQWRDYYGRIRWSRSSNGNLVGFFDSSPETKVSRFTLYIHKKEKLGTKGHPNRFYGVYAGIEFLSDKMIAGRIRLTRLNATLENIKLNLTELVKKVAIVEDSLFTNDQDLVKLFSGNSHDFDFIETYKGVEDYFRCMPLKIHNDFPFSGHYYIYSLSSKIDKISKIPLLIDHRGRVTLYRKVRALVGIATFDNMQALTINIYEKNGMGFTSQYLFSVSNLKSKTELKHAFGISSRFPINNRPSARSEILVAGDNSWDSSKGTIRLSINSKDFDEEDKNLRGLLTWLTGIYNRYIKMPLTPNEYYKYRKIEEFVNIHFYAACHLSRKGEVLNAIKNLYQAYLHGFNDLTLLNAETNSDGSLYILLSQPIKTVPGDDKEYSYLEPLSILQIIERIHQRAAHIQRLF